MNANGDFQIAGFEREHRQALDLVDHLRGELRRGTPVDVLLSKAIAFAESELEPHFQREEAFVLKALASYRDQAFVSRTESDHRLLRGLASGMRAGEVAALTAFADTLEAHVLFESREFYPICHLALTTATLQDLCQSQ